MKPRYRCTLCGQNEIEARANRCGQKDDGCACPMALKPAPIRSAARFVCRWSGRAIIAASVPALLIGYWLVIFAHWIMQTGDDIPEK